MNVSAAVMTHPTRLAAAQRLCAALAPIDATPAVDPEPHATPGAMRSARLAWAAGGPDATHHLVLQDDIELAEGFAAAVAASVALHPDAAISFFVEWGSRTAALVRWAALADASWVPMINPYVPTQALVMPAPLARDLAAFLRDETDDAEPDDEAILRFLQRRGTRMLAAVPNLVEHLDLPSLTGNEGHGVRRAACITGEPAAAPGPTVLPLPALLPFLAWVDATATTIDTADGTFSARTPTLDVLTAHGYDGDRLVAACGPALAGLTDPDGLRAGIDAKYLTELWITAVAMGALGRQYRPGADLDHPAVRAALRTTAPGALRTHVDFAVLERHTEDLAALVTAGLRYGWTA
ncbi:hypothetical protein Dvina_19370 [Dactylosporangium vinaceum]|uniref:Uncharacterized protein n=1 Tax=Dactylosporangium vinaceum TaxID=53362 RepID=A0ABV5M9G9_9ACTN|nr:hypothetical protein [Dactylosporangium vinaceum]UAC00023.1 hypothetical protein Dvina_19370 [Dactylosporangium vinaceum]